LSEERELQVRTEALRGMVNARDNLRAFDARAIVSTIGPTVVMPK
jgi:hypothetical protein